MSDVDTLIESIQRQLLKYGLDEVMREVETASAEIGDIQERVSNSFLQDFRYEGGQKVADQLRASLYELDVFKRSSGAVAGAVDEAIFRIRDA